MTGTLRGPDRADPAAGTITFWPRRVLGHIIGPRRIALDVIADRGRLRLDGEVGMPPYLTGIALPGRLSVPAGVATDGPTAHNVAPDDASSDGEAVTVWIHPAQLLELWFRFNL